MRPKIDIDAVMTRGGAVVDASDIIDFYGHKNQMTIGLMLPMLAAAHGHQLISDEE